ncbi:hypothetical protein [Streptomyces sp. NPDC056244]|uniref:hypothetical protein n=1 Tax=Streptomyces sp. NPDC056244 TaxID=3345762 RepID=UPI0035DC18ED
MPEAVRNRWEAAALRLFDDTYSFVASGPRSHGEWREDVLPVMARAVGDPRGWAVLDWDAEDERRRDDPFYPFTDPTAARLREVYEIPGEAAVNLLVAMTDEWFQVSNIPGFAERRPGMLADAEVLISRYGPDAAFYTTSVDARASSASDFSDAPDFSEKAGAGRSFTACLMDLGLIAVSDAEVGVFWSFNAN